MTINQEVLAKIAKVLTTPSAEAAKSAKAGYDAFNAVGVESQYEFVRPPLQQDQAYWEVYPEIDFVPPGLNTIYAGLGSLESEASKKVAPVKGKRLGKQVDEAALKESLAEYAAIGIQFRLFERATGKIVNYIDGYMMSERFTPFYIRTHERDLINEILVSVGANWNNLELLQVLARRGKPKTIDAYLNEQYLGSADAEANNAMAGGLQNVLGKLLSTAEEVKQAKKSNPIKEALADEAETV